MSNKSPRWEPGSNAVHRLIQLCDVMAIALNRFRQLSFRLPAENDSSYIAERQRLWDDFFAVQQSVFPQADTTPQNTAFRLATAAVAALSRMGSQDEAAVGNAQVWLSDIGWAVPFAYPKDPRSPFHEKFDNEGRFLFRYHPGGIRSGLFAALARVGEPMPDQIHQRAGLLTNTWSQGQCDPITQDELLAMVRETQPATTASSAVTTQPSHQQVTMTGDKRADPYKHRAALRTLAPQLEALTKEFAAQCEPLRKALNAMLAASPDGWVEALYAAGPHLAPLDISDKVWTLSEPTLHCSDSELARYSLVRMAQASASANRKEFDQWRGRLAAESAVGTEARRTLAEFAGHLLARAHIRAREQTVDRAQQLLPGSGVEFDCFTLSRLKQAGCVLTPVAEDVVHYWADDFSKPIRFEEGRLMPSGWRPATSGQAPNCVEEQPTVSLITNGSDMPTDPDTVYTLTDTRDLLRFRREENARIQAILDKPMLLLQAAVAPILPDMEKVRVALALRDPTPPRMLEEAAAGSAVFALLANAARQECGRELDEDALAAMVSRAAIQSGRLPAEVWQLALAEFARLKWPELVKQDRTREAKKETTNALGSAEKDSNAEQTPTAETEGSNGGKAKGIPREQAEILVRDWLLRNAKDNPAAVTRDAVAAGTGVSAGAVSNTVAWKAFRERRDAETKPGERKIPLTAEIQAEIPVDCATPAELAELIEEQEAERADEERRHKRRHKPS